MWVTLAMSFTYISMNVLKDVIDNCCFTSFRLINRLTLKSWDVHFRSYCFCCSWRASPWDAEQPIGGLSWTAKRYGRLAILTGSTYGAFTETTTGAMDGFRMMDFTYLRKQTAAVHQHPTLTQAQIARMRTGGAFWIGKMFRCSSWIPNRKKVKQDTYYYYSIFFLSYLGIHLVMVNFPQCWFANHLWTQNVPV